MNLSKYKKDINFIGRSIFIRVLWYFLGATLVSSIIPGSIWRVKLLHLFGARLGSGLVLKPGLNVKYPWKLVVGNNAWIGENVWIDNLDLVVVGSNTCISQGAYLCTGSHDWCSETFDLIIMPIVIGDRCWVCAKAVIGPGSNIGDGSVVGLGCVFSGTLDRWHIVRVNDRAQLTIKRRKIRENP